MTTNLYELPPNLPTPIDDGGASHLIGMKLPNIILRTTSNKNINVSSLSGWVVIYCYPMTGQPGVPLPEGWDQIPGARGCTPQACSFRDHFQELQNLNVKLIGISTQKHNYQKELVNRLHLPFEVLSDHQLKFAYALNLPVLEVNQHKFLKRLTLICHYSTIRHIHYPVFPTHQDPEKVIAWLRKNK